MTPLAIILLATAVSADAPRAARSVHLGYPAPAATAFYNEVTVEQSVPNTYFMACGFHHGYFGIQQLNTTNKIVIFSVWDAKNQHAETLFQAPDVEVHRFGGEGTGNKSYFRYPWKTGETCRFLVRVAAQTNQTDFTGYFYINDTRQWKRLVTFRTHTGGSLLGGLYSFVEDFRRDGKSPHECRRARFANGWILTAKGDWQELTRATFTGDSTPLDNIDAGIVHTNQFFLATGGDTTNHTPLQTTMTRPHGTKPPELPHEP